ncbi:MAG: cytochrome c [Polyangiales bacterium]
MRDRLPPRRAAGPVALAVLALTVSACRGGARREWRPEDHDSGVVSGAAPVAAPTNDDPLASARAIFVAQCASCHGTGGRGDGPMAAMFRPADLTSEALQSARDDAALTSAIVNGRGRMPAFGNQLRPEAVPLLVRLIRSWRR